MRSPRMTMVLMALLVLLFSAVMIARGDDQPHLKRRFDYKRSLRKPYFVNGNLPHFQVQGDVLPSQDYLRLTPSVQSKRGSIWSELAVPYNAWQVVFSFSITGRGRLGGDGLAFWYTTQPLSLGKAMGSNEVFDGLMLAFDTYDNDGKRDNPSVYGILNDGERSFDPETDGSDLLFASCSISFRNSPMPTWVRVTNAHGRLKVEVDINGKGKTPVVCFDQPDISLPSGYFFGFSSATGGLADDHDLISVEFYEIDPPEKQQQQHKPVEPVANQAQFDRIQEQVQEMRAKHETPFELDENYKNFLGKLSNVDDLLSELSYLSNSQRDMRQLLEDLNRNVQSLLAEVRNGGNINNNNNNNNQAQVRMTNYDNQFSQLTTKLNEIQNEVRALKGANNANPNINANTGIASLQTAFDAFNRQINERLQRMESSNPSGYLAQVIREEVAKVANQNYNNYNNNNNNYRSSSNQQSDEGVSIWVIVIGVAFAVGVIVFAGVSYFNRKSSPKKFI